MSTSLMDPDLEARAAEADRWIADYNLWIAEKLRQYGCPEFRVNIHPFRCRLVIDDGTGPLCTLDEAIYASSRTASTATSVAKFAEAIAKYELANAESAVDQVTADEALKEAMEANLVKKTATWVANYGANANSMYFFVKNNKVDYNLVEVAALGQRAVVIGQVAAFLCGYHAARSKMANCGATIAGESATAIAIFGEAAGDVILATHTETKYLTAIIDAASMPSFTRRCFAGIGTWISTSWRQLDFAADEIQPPAGKPKSD